jgi:hypothetical protein
MGVARIEGKNYEIIYRNESRYRRGDGLRRVDRGCYGPGLAKAKPAAPISLWLSNFPSSFIASVRVTDHQSPITVHCSPITFPV